MIVAFRTNDSQVLERYTENFINPKSIVMNLLHSITFTEKKITKIEDITIIESESYVRLSAKYSMLPSAVLIILGMFFKNFFMINAGSVLFIMSMILLSRHFLLLSIIIKLKLSGHKGKIEMVDDGFLISKLLMERQYGSTRSIRNVKK